VTVLGYDPGRQRAPLKRRIGIVLQSTGVEPYLTVAETIRMYAGFYPDPRPVDEVIGLVGLEEKRSSGVNKLSGGQQRRLDVAPELTAARRRAPFAWSARVAAAVRALQTGLWPFRVVTAARGRRRGADKR
jgi:ABC-type thiamine transport system ATPase subunit